jgi:hypothetical protein
MDSFLIKFNKGKQWISVTLWDVHPDTFQNWGGGRWAYFDPVYPFTSSGLFGEFHAVKSGIREDTVSHELFHVVCGIIYSRRDAITGRNEERYASLIDELTRKFFRGYRKKGK